MLRKIDVLGSSCPERKEADTEVEKWNFQLNAVRVTIKGKSKKAYIVLNYAAGRTAR